jgi:SAM-dependent methyltransferase
MAEQDIAGKYDEFWLKQIRSYSEGLKKRHEWFRRPKYRLLAGLFPKWMLTHYPARKYQAAMATLAEGSFLDMGCGTGACPAIYAARTGNLSLGFDISHAAVNFAKEEAARLRLRCGYLAADVYRAPFKTGSFDTVYIGQTIEHLHDEDTPLREARRMLAANGTLLVTVPKEDLVPSDDHVRIYTRESLEALLRRHGATEVLFHDGVDPKRFAVSARFGAC